MAIADLAGPGDDQRLRRDRPRRITQPEEPRQLARGTAGPDSPRDLAAVDRGADASDHRAAHRPTVAGPLRIRTLGPGQVQAGRMDHHPDLRPIGRILPRLRHGGPALRHRLDRHQHRPGRGTEPLQHLALRPRNGPRPGILARRRSFHLTIAGDETNPGDITYSEKMQYHARLAYEVGPDRLYCGWPYGPDCAEDIFLGFLKRPRPNAAQVRTCCGARIPPVACCPNPLHAARRPVLFSLCNPLALLNITPPAG